MNKNRRGLSRLLPFLRPQLKTLLLCLLMVLLVNAAELAKPYILEVVIDRYLTAGRPDQGLDAVWVLALGYMACVALSSVLNVSEAVMVNRMGQSILMDIRRRVFNHIQHMSMKTLDHFSSGRLITRATNDVETLNELTARVRASFILDRLEYMKKGGRCSAVAMLGANLLKLRTCIHVKEGKMGVVKKYRGSFDTNVFLKRLIIYHC